LGASAAATSGWNPDPTLKVDRDSDRAGHGHGTKLHHRKIRCQCVGVVNCRVIVIAAY
jgi:hypothetical protein